MMKSKLMVAVLVLIVAASGCKKTDNAALWVGTYTGTGNSNTINQVTISEVNSSTLQIQLQVTSGAGTITYATMLNAKLQSASAVTINETGQLAGSSDQYHYTGSGTLSGNTLTLSGQGQDVVTDSVKLYYFVGNK